LEVREVNWLGPGDGPPKDGLKVAVKLRSAQPLIGATVYGRPGGMGEVVLDDFQAGIAAGQACVFYDRERMLGGGWIVRQRER
jgi:tRNA-specific 2-thiouridylase